MQDALPAAVFKNTYSVGDLYHRADLLQRFLEHYFFETHDSHESRIDLLKMYYRDVDPETASHVAAIAAWGSEFADLFSAENVYEKMRAFKASARSYEKLTLYIPVHFGPAQMERIGSWCRAKVAPEVMLDLRIDPTAVGGCAFVYRNTFHDFSFTYFASNVRSKLVDLLRRYE